MKNLITLLCSVLIASSAFAHSPSSIKASYDQENQFLTVNVMHNTGNPKNHYIEEIEVKIADKTMLTQRFTVQYNNQEQLAMVFWPGLAGGSEITVKANCNRFGSKSKNIKL